ncbi:hypothetical protein [Streptomyces sp. A0592]|uniref:hypothetical protein n=1 Tax=Streptomyces sp. A0592 TaxID=2563099 RepID=UPI00109EAE46|nr:hypothetical protein [Streptomyces sp. A0592]THA80301.1 hypothetical protein E6U81_29470 [Streptomyces sp. A0592]
MFGEGAAVKVLAQQYQAGPKTIRGVLDAAGARELSAERLDILRDLPPSINRRRIRRSLSTLPGL